MKIILTFLIVIFMFSCSNHASYNSFVQLQKELEQSSVNASKISLWQISQNKENIKIDTLSLLEYQKKFKLYSDILNELENYFKKDSLFQFYHQEFLPNRHNKNQMDTIFAKSYENDTIAWLKFNQNSTLIIAQLKNYNNLNGFFKIGMNKEDILKKYQIAINSNKLECGRMFEKAELYFNSDTLSQINLYQFPD